MNNDTFPVYIGYDSREDIAYKVCEYSIYKNSPAAEVKPLKQLQLKRDGLYNRGEDPLSSTEFTFTRFLVPALTNYHGWALFCDCDIVWDGDIAELFKLADPTKAVMVVKHEHTPSNTVKMDGKQQTQYPRKNWSSVILWNCEHPSNQKLTIGDINTKEGSYLHRFKWLNDSEIGELPAKFNFLVGWNKESVTGKPLAYHWTEGGPWFENYRTCEYANVWWDYLISYADEIGRNSTISHSAITWVTCLSKEYYNYAANLTLPSWDKLPGDVVFVWDDKPVDLGFGKIYNFWKDVASPEDPWLKEGMGGTKADRFWKKSRTQVWAARRFKGLVVWIDADIMVEHELSKSKAIEMLHPGNNLWATLDAGADWILADDCPIDTGIVAFDTRNPDFNSFIRDYSMTWYNGDIYQLPQPYDHHAANHVRKKWPLTSYCPHFNNWRTIPQAHISRFAMENSSLKNNFTHYLGIDRKEILNNTIGKEKAEKKEKRSK
jgi:lipopolysaccharide biosynthesis glycosyltransferase